MINLLMGLPAIIAIVVVALLIILLVVWFINTYNRLVKARNRVDNSWAQIDVQLKRRFDLIPNLVETVKGYAKHESDIFTQFADARKMYADAAKSGSVKGLAEADNALNKALQISVNAVREQYPELHANANYQQLMNDLTDCENKIAYNRQFYNDTVLSYTNLRQLFPSSIVAKMFHFVEKEYFTVNDEEQREAPQVKF